MSVEPDVNNDRTVRNIARYMEFIRGDLSSSFSTARAELTGQLQKYMHLLGPTPKRCLQTFVDLGMSDAEIGRYFRIPQEAVTELREIWKIEETI